MKAFNQERKRLAIERNAKRKAQADAIALLKAEIEARTKSASGADKAGK
jgi:hypothetical protein